VEQGGSGTALQASPGIHGVSNADLARFDRMSNQAAIANDVT
jgi:hypothetical protein